MVHLKSRLINKLFIDVESAGIEKILSHFKDQTAAFSSGELDMVIKLILDRSQIVGGTIINPFNITTPIFIL